MLPTRPRLQPRGAGRWSPAWDGGCTGAPPPSPCYEGLMNPSISPSSDLESRAHELLPPAVYGYYAGAAGAGATLPADPPAVGPPRPPPGMPTRAPPPCLSPPRPGLAPPLPSSLAPLCP